MCRNHDRADRARAHSMVRRATAARHMHSSLALCPTCRIHLAMAARRTHRQLAGCGAHALDAQAKGTLVKPRSSEFRELPSSRDPTCLIALPRHSNCIDKVSKNAIKGPEGPRAGVGLAGSHGSQS